VILAVEDSLGEATARRLLAVFRPDLAPPDTVLGLKGNEYLRGKCTALNTAAAHMPVMLLMDQDVPSRCPPRLINRWLGRGRPRRLFFRVAVMEVESWVMADREAFAALVGIPAFRVPTDTDSIPDPKQFLVNLARRSRVPRIRNDLVPARKSTAQVGPAYNALLVDFVNRTWDPDAARTASPSLRRTVVRLRDAFRSG